MTISPKVSVYSIQGTVIEFITPVQARLAIKEKRAIQMNKNPFEIQLLAGIDSALEPVVRAEIIYAKREKIMSEFENPAVKQKRLNEFWDKVDPKNGGDGIVWARAATPNGNQFVCDLRIEKERVPLPPMRAGKPVCLAPEFCSFDQLKIARGGLSIAVQKGYVKLMTSADAEEYFTKKAATLQTSAEELVRRNHEEEQAILEGRKIEVDRAERERQALLMAQELEPVNPRIVNLCKKVDPSLPPNNKLPVVDFLEEASNYEEFLKQRDFEYIRDFGFYPSVKKWAVECIKRLAAEASPEVDELMQETPPAKSRKKS